MNVSPSSCKLCLRKQPKNRGTPHGDPDCAVYCNGSDKATWLIVWKRYCEEPFLYNKITNKNVFLKFQK